MAIVQWQAQTQTPNSIVWNDNKTSPDGWHYYGDTHRMFPYVKSPYWEDPYCPKRKKKVREKSKDIWEEWRKWNPYIGSGNIPSPKVETHTALDGKTDKDEILTEIVEIENRLIRRIIRCDNCNAPIRKDYRDQPCEYCGH